MPFIHTVLRRHTTAAGAPRRGAAARLAGAALAAALAACGGRDPFAPDPANNADTQESDLRVYALSRASGPLGSAVNLLELFVLRPGLVGIEIARGVVVPAPNFDVAVDLAPDGRVRLLPSSLVVDVTGVGQVYRTGLQVSTAAYESIAEAPNGGYQADSAVTAAVGESVIAQFQSGACTTYYAKVTVLAVDAASGVVTLRGRVNPNCGYRSLNPGRG
jgi:hypothetical protein